MSNCLFFAIKKLCTEGGYIVFRKSSYGGWFHVIWSKDLVDFYHYVPEHKPLKYPYIHKMLFKGVVTKVKVYK